MYTVYQLGEAKRLILKGDIFSLKMAFVLLDNAIEILMYRRIKSDLAYNDVWLRHDEQMKAELDTKKYEDWRKYTGLKIVEKKRIHLIDRYFDEKVKFLSENKPRIKQSEVSTLRSLHKYRNEIYHKDHVRRETIQASTIILFEIACDLLPRLHHGIIGYSSVNSDKEERRKFFDEFKDAGDTSNYMLKTTGLRIIKNLLKKDVSLSCDELRKVLQETMKGRLSDSLGNLDFIKRDGFTRTSKGQVLKIIQFTEKRSENPIKHKSFLGFIPEFTMKNFSVWRKKIKKLDRINNKISLFKAFSEIEKEFERLESIIIKTASSLDEAIQLEIDIQRGK